MNRPRAYCDAIARILYDGMRKNARKSSSYIDNVGFIRDGDISREQRSMTVVGRNGTIYIVSVECMNNGYGGGDT